MEKTVKGSFEVDGEPLPLDELTQSLSAMRMGFKKEFKGPLTATSVVSMMGMMNMELGSGAYVALERLTGTLDGRKGSFCLHHSSSLDRGKPRQSVLVIPDSGTDELKGLSGSMVIDVVGDDHFYTFTYSLK